MWETTEIGRGNICSEDKLDQIGKGEGLAGDSNCHYVLGLPVEHPMTERRVFKATTSEVCALVAQYGYFRLYIPL